MTISMSVLLESMAFTMRFVFNFWPFVVLAPIRRGKHLLHNMTVMWVMLLVFWFFSLFTPTKIQSFLIPEPLNTFLFFVAGAALIGMRVWLRQKERQDIQIKADKASNVEDLRRLSPTEFENMVVELYTGLGHKARRTGAVGDHGVDVIVQAKNGEKWVVQCKRWRGNVGEPVVRDFYGTMHHEKADKGAIITTGTFTPQAREWAKGKPLSLIEGDEFLSYVKKARAKVDLNT